MTNQTRRVFVAALLGAATFFSSAGERFPNRPVSVIVPAAAGTEVDWLAREYAHRLSVMWKVPVVVDNRVGASGDIGTGQAARAAADGHTLLFTGGSFAINPVLKKTSYDPRRSFVPIMHAGSSYFVLVVSQKLGVKSLPELIQLAKSKPGVLHYASPGNGTVHHLAMEMFMRQAGIQLRHVPFKGAATAINDLSGGFVDALIVSAPQVIDLEKAGRVKILMTISQSRDQRIPSVPTAAEAGYPDFRLAAWSGVLAPANTPPAIVKKINEDLHIVRSTRAFQETVVARFNGRDKLDNPGTPEELARTIEADLVAWKRVIEQAAISTD